MIGSSHRFHGHASLRSLYSRSQTIRLSPVMLLRYQATNRHLGYRAAVIVSRKVNKSAVVRNRIRRRVYSNLTSCESQLDKPYDLVFLVLSDTVATVPADELRDLILAQLRQAGALSPPDVTGQAHVIVKKVQKED